VQLEIVSTVHQQNVATSDLDFVIRMGDPGEDELVGKKVANVSFGIFASVEILGKTPGARTLAELTITTSSDRPRNFQASKTTAPAK